jgi:hypothetical protein
MLEQLQARRAFGWPEGVPVPRIDPRACASHFQLDASKWATVCDRSAQFYARTAYERFDPLQRLKLADQYERAAHEFTVGRYPPDHGLPSLEAAISISRRTR